LTFEGVEQGPPTAIQFALPVLVAALTIPDPDPVVRANVAWALGKLPERKEPVTALINAVKQSHVNVGEAAALSLMGMSRTALPELKLALQDSDANSRWKVAWILGQ